MRAWWQDLAAAKRQSTEVGEGDPVYELPDTFPNEAEAIAAASTKLAKSSRGKAAASITLPGRADIAAETPLELRDFRPENNGAWRVKSAQHRFDSSGFTTTLELESPE